MRPHWTLHPCTCARQLARLISQAKPSHTCIHIFSAHSAWETPHLALSMLAETKQNRNNGVTHTHTHTRNFPMQVGVLSKAASSPRAPANRHHALCTQTISHAPASPHPMALCTTRYPRHGGTAKQNTRRHLQPPMWYSTPRPPAVLAVSCQASPLGASQCNASRGGVGG